MFGFRSKRKRFALQTIHFYGVLDNYTKHRKSDGRFYLAHPIKHKHIQMPAASSNPLSVAYFSGSEALCADVHLLGITAGDLDTDALNVGIPDAVGSSMRMADVISEMSALSTDFTLCHDHTSYLTGFDRLTAQGFIYAQLCRYRSDDIPESGSSIRSTRPLLQSVLYV